MPVPSRSMAWHVSTTFAVPDDEVPFRCLWPSVRRACLVDLFDSAAWRESSQCTNAARTPINPK